MALPVTNPKRRKKQIPIPQPTDRSETNSLELIAGKYEGPEWQQLRKIIAENRRQVDAQEPSGD